MTHLHPHSSNGPKLVSELTDARFEGLSALAALEILGRIPLYLPGDQAYRISRPSANNFQITPCDREVGDVEVRQATRPFAALSSTRRRAYGTEYTFQAPNGQETFVVTVMERPARPARERRELDDIGTAYSCPIDVDTVRERAPSCREASESPGGGCSGSE